METEKFTIDRVMPDGQRIRIGIVCSAAEIGAVIDGDPERYGHIAGYTVERVKEGENAE